MSSQTLDKITEFDGIVRTISDRYNASNPINNHLLQDLYNDAYRLINEFKSFVDVDYAKFSDQEKYLLLSLRSKTSEDLKQLLLLYRDSYFENLKAKSYLKDNLVNQDEVEKLNKTTYNTLIKVLQNLSSNLNELKSNANNASIVEKSNYRFSLMEDPWAVYVGQFNQILEQIRSLEKQNQKFPKSIDLFKKIKSSFQDTVLNVNQKINNLGAFVAELKSKISDETITKSDLNSVLHNFEIKDRQIPEVKEILEDIYSDIQTNESQQFIVNHDNGKLITKSFVLNEKIRKWLDLYIVPQLSDLFDKYRILNSAIEMDVKNFQKRLAHIDEMNKEASLNDIELKLDQIQNDFKNHRESLNKINEQMEDAFESEFVASNIFKDTAFLPLRIQKSVNKLVKDQSKLLQVINQRFGKGQEDLVSFFDSLQRTDTISKDEKLVYTLAKRSGSNSTESYDQIFRSADMYSDFYLVDRNVEYDRAEKAVNLWRQGFDSSIVLHGAPLSGKSTFANLLIQRFFSRNYIKLQLDSENAIAGRKFNTNTNLKLALEEISKARIDQPFCLFIDDLEVWHDDVSSLVQDARALLNFKNKYHSNVFVIVALNPISLHFLNVYLNFSDKFLSNIDLSKSMFYQFKNAIELRHAATQKTLVKKNGIEYSSTELNQLLRAIYNDSNSNIGDGLIKWAACTKEIKSDQIVFDLSDLKMTNIITAENEIIFEQFFKFKKLTDKELVLLFTKEQFEEIRPELNALIGKKVLERSKDGKIAINPLLTNDIYRFYCQRVSHKYQNLIQ